MKTIQIDDKRSEQMKKKNPYETVEYVCPECGAIASQTWTAFMNKLFIEQIEGTVCPDCEERGLMLKESEEVVRGTLPLRTTSPRYPLPLCPEDEDEDF